MVLAGGADEKAASSSSSISTTIRSIILHVLVVVLLVASFDTVIFVDRMTMTVEAFVVPTPTNYYMGSTTLSSRGRSKITTTATTTTTTNFVVLKSTTVTSDADDTAAVTENKQASSTSSTSTSTSSIPRLSLKDLHALHQQGYVVIENFIPSSQAPFKEALRDDVRNLRTKQKFKIAKIGQDTTNTLNEEIRVAETCFIGRHDKPQLREVYNPSRERLYDILDTIRDDLEEHSRVGSSPTTIPLDPKLSEFLYAYYPSGGFYRRHRDAVKGSASWLRQYSLLLYLNDYDTTAATTAGDDGDTKSNEDANNVGGQLRIHFDSGGDFLPTHEIAKYKDIEANGGTLVLFESSKFPHEVLDTYRERFAIVGWYNRPMSFRDIQNIMTTDTGTTGSNNANGATTTSISTGSTGDGNDNSVKMIGLAVAAGLVTVGMINLLGAM